MIVFSLIYTRNHKFRIMKSLKVLLITLLFSAILNSCSMAEGGVRVSNNMEKYAIEYLQEHSLLEEDEKVQAYYDYTISLDGSEAVLLTNSRLIYHNAETSDTSINLVDITNIEHRTESLIGDIIEISSKDGSIFMVEIAPLNQGATFLSVLKAKTNMLK